MWKPVVALSLLLAGPAVSAEESTLFGSSAEQGRSLQSSGYSTDAAEYSTGAHPTPSSEVDSTHHLLHDCCFTSLLAAVLRSGRASAEMSLGLPELQCAYYITTSPRARSPAVACMLSWM